VGDDDVSSTLPVGHPVRFLDARGDAMTRGRGVRTNHIFVSHWQGDAVVVAQRWDEFLIWMYQIRFDDGCTIWACPWEVTALTERSTT